MPPRELTLVRPGDFTRLHEVVQHLSIPGGRVEHHEGAVLAGHVEIDRHVLALAVAEIEAEDEVLTHLQDHGMGGHRVQMDVQAYMKDVGRRARVAVAMIAELPSSARAEESHQRLAQIFADWPGLTQSSESF